MVSIPITCITCFFLAATISVAQTSEGTYKLRLVIGEGSRGDGGTAVQALVEAPSGLAEDSRGNVYISEKNSGVIRRVRPDGVIERFAGTGIIANGAEGRPALKTDLIGPTTLVVDSDGGLIFAEPQACMIRKIMSDGTVRNYVGTGNCGDAAGGFPGGGGSSATAVRRPLATEVGTVGGMVVDGAGRLIFSDETYHIVRRLDSDGFVRPIAGVGVAGYVGDAGVDDGNDSNDKATSVLPIPARARSRLERQPLCSRLWELPGSTH